MITWVKAKEEAFEGEPKLITGDVYRIYTPEIAPLHPLLWGFQALQNSNYRVFYQENQDQTRIWLCLEMTVVALKFPPMILKSLSTSVGVGALFFHALA